MAVDYREKILALVKLHPVQPTFVSKVLNTDSMLASAMLGEMASKGILKISNLKVGSSPLYYLPENAQQLQQYTNVLNEKDRKTYELLKENNVLRDSALDPLTRVSLRALKDFAMPLEANFNNSKEIFWKWYLTNENDAVQVIKNMLVGEENKLELVNEEKNQEVRREEKKEEVQQQLGKNVQEKQEQKLIKQRIPKEDKFMEKIKKYFAENGIKIIEDVMIKKNSEHDFIIEMATALGKMLFYCKAKDKKIITDSDLNGAYVQGQLKKLPALIISQGELNKKAQMIIEELRGLAFKKIE